MDNRYGETTARERLAIWGFEGLKKSGDFFHLPVSGKKCYVVKKGKLYEFQIARYLQEARSYD